MSILFFALLGVYAFLGRQLDYWITVRLLDMPTACPAGFLRNESPYHWVVWLSFLAALGVGLYCDLSSWIVGPSLFVAWHFAGSSGHSAAFRQYRERMQEFMKYADTPEDRARWEMESKKTDAEISDLLDVALGITRRK